MQNQWNGPLLVNEGTADEVMLGGSGFSSCVNDTENVLQLMKQVSWRNRFCHRYHHHHQLRPHATCTHIYPLQVAVGLRWGHHSVVGVDDGYDVHAQQLLQCAV